MMSTPVPRHTLIALTILIVTSLFPTTATAGTQLCDSTVSTSASGLYGTTPPMAFDGTNATAFRSSNNNWQFLQLRFDCEIELTALRRFMTPNGSSTNGHRGWQGEQVSYSLDGQTFHYITPAASSGWESYVAYHPRAWHSVEYGLSRWLVPDQKIRARYVRFHWDGNYDYLHEVELDARAVLETTNFRLTQSGMVTTAVPSQPLVAGKTTLLRATVIRVAGGPTTADEAFVDVIREDTGAVTGTIRGHAIASDNRSLRTTIAEGEDVHFFIPGRRLRDETTYRFRVRLVSGGQSHTTTVFTGIATRENAGLPVLFTDYNEGLFASLGDLLRFIDAVIHTSRILPIKDTNDGLLPYGTPTTGARGLRYEYVMNLPLASPGRLGQFVQDFVQNDTTVGTGNNAAGQNCASNIPRAFNAGPFFAYNFTFPEDLDGNNVLDAAELAQCRPGAGGTDSPLRTRISNFGSRIWTDIAQRKASTMASGREFPNYGLQLVPNGPTRHHRLNWLGYAGPTSGWAAVSMAGNPFPALPHELVHELGRNHSPTTSLPGPGYDLKRKRRVPNPFDLMAGSFDPNQNFFNSFMSDTDWNALLATIPTASGQTQPPPIGPPTVRMTGTIDSQGTLSILRTRTLPAATELESLNADMTVALLDDGDNVLTSGPVEVSEAGGADWPKELPPPLNLDLRGEVEWVEEAVALAVFDESGQELTRLDISSTAPVVTVLDVDTESDPIVVDWKGYDPDKNTPTYDVSFVYPDGREVLAAAEVDAQQTKIPANRVPGGDDVAVRVRATDGFRVSVDELSGLSLPNRAPQITILAPVAGETFETGAAVALVATTQDLEDEAVDVTWTSDHDGFLGTGDELTLKLSSGSHQLTATASDTAGGESTMSVAITVE